MKDELEDFIKRNRAAFDDRTPSEKVWQRISGALSFSKTVSLWNSVPVWRAAAVVFMLLSAYLLIPKNTFQRQQVAFKEFNDVEQFYIEQISEKTQLIATFEGTEGLNGFTHDFKQLEAMYMVLKDEMKQRPSKQVKDALVLNLLVRIDLLNQQLQKLENGDYQSDDENSQDEKQKQESKNT
jgi:hypothetical protein